MYSVFYGYDNEKKNPNFNEKTGKTTTYLHKSSDDESILRNKPFLAIGQKSRNSLCSCGSGKKFKKCCMKNERTVDIFDKIKSPSNETLKRNKP